MKPRLYTVLCAAALTVGPGAAATVATQSPTTTTATKAAHDIQERIERRLHDDAALSQHDVKVSVAGQVATLTGTVPTKADRDRAARLARTDGITRVDNKIVVDRSVRATSGRIDTAAEKTKAGTAKVIDKTKEGLDKGLDKSKEGIETGVDKSKEGVEAGVDKSKEGVETGVEKSKEGVAVAGEKSASGVRKVGSDIADAFVLASVKARFFGDDALKGSDINVDCDSHVVTLKGTVPNEAARQRAIELARKTDGVDRVVDRLTIGPKK